MLFDIQFSSSKAVTALKSSMNRDTTVRTEKVTGSGTNIVMEAFISKRFKTKTVSTRSVLSIFSYVIVSEKIFSKFICIYNKNKKKDWLFNLSMILSLICIYGKQ